MRVSLAVGRPRPAPPHPQHFIFIPEQLQGLCLEPGMLQQPMVPPAQPQGPESIWGDEEEGEPLQIPHLEPMGPEHHPSGQSGDLQRRLRAAPGHLAGQLPPGKFNAKIN